MKLNERKRTFDVEKLTLEEADSLSEQIGNKVKDICDEAVKKANKILNIYGLKAKMAIQIEGLQEEQKEEQS